MPRYRPLFNSLAILASLAALLTSGCSQSGQNQSDSSTGTGDSPGGGSCPAGIDRSVDIDTAIPLAEGTETDGYICPRNDQDYYEIVVPAGKPLLRVKLQHSAPVTPISLNYLIMRASNEVVQRAPTGQNNRFDALHRLDPGTYYLLVQDQGNDAFDGKNKYRLSYTTEADPDTAEPNNAFDEATTAGTSNTGYISYVDDVDFFKVSVGADQLLKVVLTTAEPLPVDLKHTIYRRVADRMEPLFSDNNPNGSQGATQLETIQAVPEADTYYIAVEDTDANDNDVDTPYTIAISTPGEPDTNDQGTRNDHPSTATPLTSYSGSCVTRQITGRIASAADVDYFKITTSGTIDRSHPAVMDINLTYAGSTIVDPAIALVYPRSGNACTSDKCCRVIEAPANDSCVNALSCTGSSFVCLPRGEGFCNDPICAPDAQQSCPAERKCAGSVTCLPEGVCGVQQFTRRATDGATLNEAQPLFHAGPWYLRVADLGGDELDFEETYTLDVTICPDPDSWEMDNGYFPRLLRQSNAPPVIDAEGVDARNIQSYFASQGTTDTRTLNTWIEGYISYEHDEDHFEIANPCPGAACLLKIDYRTTGTCPASGLEFNIVLHTEGAFGGADVRTPAGGTGGQVLSSGYPEDGCRVLLRRVSSARLVLSVGDLNHNSWSRTCKYGVQIRKVYDGCPIDGPGPCDEADGTGVCFKP